MAFVIGNPVLTIERIPNSINRKVRVQYVIAFDQQDIAGNRPYRELVRLFGEDVTSADDELSGGPLQDTRVQPDGQGTIARDWDAERGRGTLDEDPRPLDLDEIYAKVSLVPRFEGGRAFTVKSNVVKINASS